MKSTTALSARPLRNGLAISASARFHLSSEIQTSAPYPAVTAARPVLESTSKRMDYSRSSSLSPGRSGEAFTSQKPKSGRLASGSRETAQIRQLKSGKRFPKTFIYASIARRPFASQRSKTSRIGSNGGGLSPNISIDSRR